MHSSFCTHIHGNICWKAKEISVAAKGLAEGQVDIVVGTHKLLSESVKFKDLGLLIIDE